MATDQILLANPNARFPRRKEIIMRVQVFRTTLKVALGLVLLYLFYLAFVGIRANSLLNDAKETYNAFQKNELDNSVQRKYLSLLPRIKFLREQLDNPLIKPLISISGRGDQLAEVKILYDDVEDLLPALPDLLGASRPQRYLVAFQNSAEARGTGGIIGAFAILRIHRGQIEIERVGSNYLLKSQSVIPIKMPSEYYTIYRQDPAIWQNSNMSPHFPYGARIWLALWHDQFDDDLDGVIALDPIVLSHILKVTGPIRASGQEITSENVVQESLSESYLRYESDNLARKIYLVTIIKKVARAALDEKTDRVALVRSLITPIQENRILLYNRDRALQVQIRRSRPGGVLSPTPSKEFRAVIQNTAGNKMDYYLERRLTIRALTCSQRPKTEVRFTVTNTARRDTYLPAYVKGRLDLGLPGGKENSTAIAAFLYGPPGARLVSAKDEGKTSAIGFVKVERGRQALTVPLDLGPLESRTIVAIFRGGKGPVSTHLQPLVRPQTTIIEDKCAS